MSPDSTHYLFFSLHIYHHLDFGPLYTVWPPGYPSLVALAQILHPSPVIAATVVSSVSLFLSLLFTAFILLREQVSVIFRFGAVLLLFLNPSFLFIYQFAWSEGPFVAITMAMIYFIIRHHDTDRVAYLIIAAVLAASAPLVRYLGYYAVVLFGIYLGYNLYLHKRYSIKEIGLVAFFIVLISLPSLGWMYRNFIMDGTLHGPRIPSEFSFWVNTWRMFRTTVFDNREWIIGGLFLAPIILVGWVTNGGLLARKTQSGFRDSSLIRWFPLMMAVFALVFYLALTIYSASTAAFDALDSRFSAIYYPLLIIILVLGLNAAQLRREPVEWVLAKAWNFSLIWFMIFAVLITGLFEGAKYFRRDFSHKQLYHYEFGFNRSASKHMLSAWVGSLKESGGRPIILYILTDTRDGEARPYLGRSLLFWPIFFDSGAESAFYPVGDDLEVRFNGKGGSVYRISFRDGWSEESGPWSVTEDRFAILLDSKRFIGSDLRGKLDNRCTVEYLGELYVGVSCDRRNGLEAAKEN